MSNAGQPQNVAFPAGPPVFGQKAVTSTAAALAATNTYQTSLTIYPDPNADVFVGSANTVTSSTGCPLRAGGAPMVLLGPVDVATIFLVTASTATVGYVGQ